MADKVYDVTVRRAIVQEMCVGVSADSEETATAAVLATAKVAGNAGWVVTETSASEAVTVKKRSGMAHPVTGRWLEPN